MRLDDEKKFSCFLCDTWWIWLIVFFVVLALVLTRDYWMPILGLV